jgi:hypothetical protein
MKAGAKGLGVVKKSKKHEVIKFSDSEMAKAEALLKASRAKTVAELQGKGIPARVILKAMGVSGG